MVVQPTITFYLTILLHISCNNNNELSIVITIAQAHTPSTPFPSTLSLLIITMIDNETKSTQQGLLKDSEVVFETPAVYSPSASAILLLAPIAMLLSTILTLMTPFNSLLVASLCLASAIITLMYAFLLPTRYDVLSDQSVRVHVSVPGVVHSFDYIVCAYDLEEVESNNLPHSWWMRAARVFNHVVVERQDGSTALLVSPQDKDGFMRAVNKLTVV
jgi:hypothetical protein